MNPDAQGDTDSVMVPHTRKNKLCVYPAMENLVASELKESGVTEAIPDVIQIPECLVFGKIEECSRAPTPPSDRRVAPSFIDENFNGNVAHTRSKDPPPPYPPKRINTPVFGVIDGAYNRRHKHSMTTSYCRTIDLMCQAFGCVFETWQYSHALNKWTFNELQGTHMHANTEGRTTASLCCFRGFVAMGDLYTVSALVCHRVSIAANKYGWGVDSDQIWPRLPIYFLDNYNSDGLQWAEQVRHVFPKRSERLNWALQFRLRTLGLQATYVNDVSGHKIVYHKNKCVSCGRKTKSWHVLACCFCCLECIDEDSAQFLLVCTNTSHNTRGHTHIYVLAYLLTCSLTHSHHPPDKCTSVFVYTPACM